MSAHTSFRQGQPVFVQTKDGERKRDVFVERRSGFVVLRHSGRLAKSKIRAMSVAR